MGHLKGDVKSLLLDAHEIDNGRQIGYNPNGGEGSMMTFTAPRCRDGSGSFPAAVERTSLMGLQILKLGLAFMALEGRLY
jgi:hypothetical protein